MEQIGVVRNFEEGEELDHDALLGGRLKIFQRNLVDASRWQRNVIQRGLRWKFILIPPQPSLERITNLQPTRYPIALEDTLTGFLNKGVITNCLNPLFISKLFTVPKQDGGRRLILDLSNLNLFLQAPSFHLPSIKNLKDSLPLGSWVAKLDLKDAYLHVPINQEYQPYLAFQWGMRFFQFQALPFGLCLAQAVFQGIINFPLRKCRDKGISCLVYLDDWITWADSKAKCRENISFIRNLLVNLGFLINISKSQLVPSQEIIWLGALWDTKELLVYIPLEKRKEISNLVKEMLNSSVVTRKMWEKLQGHMTFAGFVSPHLNLMKKMIGPVLDQAPLDPHGIIGIPQSTLQTLIWWSKVENLGYPYQFLSRPANVLVWTDACEKGWGGHDQWGNWVADDWDVSTQDLHMNLKELKAVNHPFNHH